jgi:hypothetical protein
MKWCILTTSPARTLQVEKSLTDAGFTVWTPKATERRRIGRKREQVEQCFAVAPGYLFADADQLHRLISASKSAGAEYRRWDRELRRMVAHRHPPFTVFRYQNEFAVIGDAALDPLRLAERRSKALPKKTLIELGKAVLFPGSGFEGLTGVVDAIEGSYAVVRFPGLPIPVKVRAAYLLNAA